MSLIQYFAITFCMLCQIKCLNWNVVHSCLCKRFMTYWNTESTKKSNEFLIDLVYLKTGLLSWFSLTEQRANLYFFNYVLDRYRHKSQCRQWLHAFVCHHHLRSALSMISRSADGIEHCYSGYVFAGQMPFQTLNCADTKYASIISDTETEMISYN